MEKFDAILQREIERLKRGKMKRIDKIRQMSVDELAVFLSMVDDELLKSNYCTKHCPLKEECDKGDKCIDDDQFSDYKWWLKQEVSS